MFGMLIVVHFNGITGNLKIINGLLEIWIFSSIVEFESLDFGMFIHELDQLFDILCREVIAVCDGDSLRCD